MVIKGTRIHQANCFAQKIDYIMSDKGRAYGLETFELFKNVRGHNRDGAVNSFETNDRYRQENAKRKKVRNSVVCYHDIISFHHRDKQNLTDEKLQDLTEKYIELRCPNAVVYSKAHIHNKNIHVHLLISGSEYKSQVLTRLSDAKWKKVRKDIEQYQKEQYPELRHSLVYQNLGEKKRKGKAKRLEDEKMLKKRQPTKILDKDLMKNAVRDFFKVARSEQHFQDLMKGHGVEFYQRKIGGKEQPYGVLCNGRKMRFSTIGLDKGMMEELKFRTKNEGEYKDNDSIISKYTQYRIRRNKPKDKDRGMER
ncbi:MAG: relaxase/mobilization nuclease domain-containing protein, partial [Saprospiraceae bacterium]